MQTSQENATPLGHPAQYAASPSVIQHVSHLQLRHCLLRHCVAVCCDIVSLSAATLCRCLLQAADHLLIVNPELSLFESSTVSNDTFKISLIFCLDVIDVFQTAAL